MKFWKHQLSFKENEIKYLDKSLYEESEAAEIMQGFLNGLMHVHERNYIHRDIKPENIQLATHLKIVDFGFSAK
jgi:serine/threonine protein kinase